MAVTQTFSMYLTNLNGEFRFLKISGQINKQNALRIEALIEESVYNFENRIGVAKPNSLRKGLICAAKYAKDGNYYRAKILNFSSDGRVLVLFIDYGNKDLVDVGAIRLLDDYSPELTSMAPQATDFILARAMHPSGAWDLHVVNSLQNTVCNTNYQCVIERHTVTQDLLINFQFNNKDFSEFLCLSGYAIRISLIRQEQILKDFPGGSGVPEPAAVAFTYPPPPFPPQVQPAPSMVPQFTPIPSVLTQAHHPPFGHSMIIQDRSVLPPQQPITLSPAQKLHTANKMAKNMLPPRPLNRSVSGGDQVISIHTPANVLTNTKSTSPLKDSSRPQSTYKTKMLEINSQHSVYISYSEGGPKLFAIQLQSTRNQLQTMMEAINMKPHRSLTEPPSIGSVCLGRHSEGKVMCRAVVMGAYDQQCNLFFVDFGVTELVSYYDIFDIPEEYVKPCVFALRFCLSGIKEFDVTQDVIQTFKDTVLGHNLMLKVVPPEGPPLIQYCELYLKGRSVKDILKEACQSIVYTFDRLPLLAVDSDYSVLVSFVDSCTNFFIQLTDNIDSLNAVMNNVELHCKKNDKLDVSKIKVGMACCALFPDDSNWYRAEVVTVSDLKVNVRYIDYGNEQEIAPDLLRPITEKLLKLKAQAIRCSLKGYEDKPVKQTASNQLEMLALEKTLRAHVYKLLDDGSLLVDLLDETSNPPLDIARRMTELTQPRHSRTYVDPSEKPAKNQKSVQEDTFEEPSSEASPPKHEKQRYERSDRTKHDRQDQPRSEKTDRLKRDIDSSKRFGGDSRTRNRYEDSNRLNKSHHNSDFSSKTETNDTSEGNNNESPKDSWGDKPSFKSKSSGYQPRDSKSRDDGHRDDNRWNDNRRYANRRDDRQDDKEGEKKWDSNQKKKSGDRPKSSFSDAGSDKSFSSYSKPRSGFSTAAEPKSLPNPSPVDVKYVNQNIELQSQHEVSITWFVSPDSFYIQLTSFQQQLSAMMQSIPDMYKGVSGYSGKVELNSTIMAKFPEDNVLYRATVVGIKPGYKYLVQYVDFGNKSVVDSVNLWQADNELLTLPKLAIHCKLEGIAPSNGAWQNSADIDACFNAPRYQCMFHSLQEDGTFVVSLWSNSVSVAGLLIERGLAVSAESALSSVLKDEPIDLNIIVMQELICKVSHVDSMGKFFLQLDPAKAAAVEEAVTNYKTENLQKLSDESLIDGCHCIVKTTEGPIYRAISVDTSNKKNVKLVLPDSGREVIVSSENVMALPDELTIYYYQSLQCGLHNFVAESSEVLMTDEEFKAKIQDNKFIAHIDNVIEGRLEVTLYDYEEGLKLEFFKPDEGAYERVPVPCHRPVFNENFGIAFVSHVDSLDKIYLQKSCDSNTLAQLLDSLFTHYETECKGEPLSIFEEESICAAKSPDGNWYRSVILKCDDDACQVQFIDYGNCDNVLKSDLRKLDLKFNQPHELALKVSLGLVPLTEDAADKFLEMASDKEIQVTLIPGEVWLANLYIEGVDLGAKLVSEVLAVSAIAATEDEFDEKAEEPSRTPGSTLVYITHIDTPGQFWLQLASDVDSIENIQTHLQDISESLPNAEKIDIGTLCVAKYSADEQWYRAEILDSDNDIITVRFIDYGNTDVLDNLPGLIKELPPDIEVNVKDRYALKCSVNATPTGIGQWTEPASDLFTSSIGNLEDPVDALIILKDVTTYVDLYVSGKNITDVLVSNGFASKSDREESGGLGTCFASHINSPSEFWVQLESSIPDLQLIENEMTLAENFPPLVDIEEGVICAAKYPEDEMWYRAQIVINGSNGTEVLFMDYGNASLTTELRNLPDQLKAKPALSRKCALQKPTNIKSWSQQAELKFSELAADGATIFNVQFIASGDISIVELYLNDLSITEELVSLCESPLSTAERPSPIGQDNLAKGSVVLITSPNDFYLQLDNTTSDLQKITESLLDAENFESVEDVEVGQVYAAQWTEDDEWYRSKILTKREDSCEVFFIDFGNKVVCHEFHALPEDILAIKPLIQHCSLAIDGDKLSNELQEKFEEFIAEGEVSDPPGFDVEILDSHSDPVLVKIFLNGVNIAAKLMADLENNARPDSVAETILEKTSKSVPEDGGKEKESYAEEAADIDRIQAASELDTVAQIGYDIKHNNVINLELSSVSSDKTLETEKYSEESNVNQENCISEINLNTESDNKEDTTTQDIKLARPSTMSDKTVAINPGDDQNNLEIKMKQESEKRSGDLEIASVDRVTIDGIKNDSDVKLEEGNAVDMTNLTSAVLTEESEFNNVNADIKVGVEPKFSLEKEDANNVETENGILQEKDNIISDEKKDAKNQIGVNLEVETKIAINDENKTAKDKNIKSEIIVEEENLK